jgi:hypothetical protein
MGLSNKKTFFVRGIIGRPYLLLIFKHNTKHNIDLTINLNSNIDISPTLLPIGSP